MASPSRIFIWLLAGIVSIAGCTAAAAEGCPTSRSEIETDRPDVTNSSLVVPKGSFQSENGINVSRRNGADIVDATNSRIRFGVAECLEVLVDLPNYFAAVHGVGDSGFSNVAPAIKWQFNQLPDKFGLSATVGLGLPTGTRSIAGPGPQPYLQFPWSLELAGGWGISGMFTNFFIPSDPLNKTVSEATFVLEREIGERSSLFVEYVGDFPSHAGSAQLINSGGVYRITPTQQIDFHLGFGVNRNAPTYIFGLGYSFRIDGLF